MMSAALQAAGFEVELSRSEFVGSAVVMSLGARRVGSAARAGCRDALRRVPFPVQVFCGCGGCSDPRCFDRAGDLRITSDSTLI